MRGASIEQICASACFNAPINRKVCWHLKQNAVLQLLHTAVMQNPPCRSETVPHRHLYAFPLDTSDNIESLPSMSSYFSIKASGTMDLCLKNLDVKRWPHFCGWWMQRIGLLFPIHVVGPVV
eukprot:GEMP01095639.1.p1 GENE.GEMP01095639.1~~GEMP01095639.1.p1  ORF type:complete len:122 (-),score=11.11 GEMP01095639.1:3-368(-)